MRLGISLYAWNPPAEVLALRSSSCRSQRNVKSPKVIQHKRLRGSAMDADGCRLGGTGLKTKVETPEAAIPDQAASSGRVSLGIQLARRGSTHRQTVTCFRPLAYTESHLGHIPRRSVGEQ
jgi:hypothetical protein